MALAAPAAKIFYAMPHRDIVSYNAAMLAFARGGEARGAVATYSELRNKSPSLGYSYHTFLALLVACTELMDRELARQFHAHLAVLGFLSDVNIASSLLDVYRKCGCVGDAGRLFDEMPVKDVQMWTTIVCAYAEDGQLDAARRLFDQMPERNAISWNTLSEGYVRQGKPIEALSMFQLLKMEKLGPDQFTFASCLSACGAMCSLKHGQQIHGMLIRSGFDQSVMISSSLIDMYSKCGCMAAAKQVFSLTEGRNAVLWNGMLSALCHHRHAQEVIGLFVQMNWERQKPDADTFLLVLTACCHCSLAEEGVEFFDLMTEKYRIIPGEKHYICMVDLVSQASSNDKVVEWVKSSPFGFNKRVWEILIRNCTIHGNIELLSKVEEHMSEFDGP
jgi:pentatricopeptide repeat protein